MSLRLTTWNCGRGKFDAKVSLVEALKPDVAVIQEVAKPVAESPATRWFGENPNQGVAVLARGGYRLEPLERQAGAPANIVPVLVSGPLEFTLFAVYTTAERPFPYVQAACVAVDTYSDLIRARPAVFAGDFNSNAIWDNQHPKARNHSALVRRMAEHGLVSAYHHARSQQHGRELEPTYYHQWKRAQPFHIDYCFVPLEWAAAITAVEVGDFESWEGKSDHRPLTIDTDL